MSDGIILRQGINSTSDNNEIQGNLNISGDTSVGGIISGDGSGLTNIPISGTSNLQTELDGKTDLSLFNSHTGDTSNPHQTSFSNLTSTAHTHSISDVVNLQTELDGKLETTTFNSYTGSVVDVFVSSGNADAGTQQLTFTNTTGGTFNVTNASALFSDNDINVTGGTYNPTTGCVTFTTNSGTTFDVCGFVTGITDTFVTGYTYSDNTFTLSRNQGLSDLTATIDTLTGLTIDGVLSATTYTGITLNDLDDVTINIPTTPDNTYQGELVYFDAVNNQWVSGAEYGNLGEVTIWGKKGSAGTIDKGCPVYITGFDNDIHEVELANATTATTMPVIGFTGEDFDNAGVYPIITFGKISGLDTTSTVSTLNPNGETWAVNDVLYMNTTDGGLTKNRPSGTNTQIQRIAKVLTVDATGGQLFIFNTARTAGLPNLTTDYVWLGNGNDTPQEVIKTDLGVSVTGFSYDNNNTFTITDDNSGSYTATINQVSGLTINGDLDVTGDTTLGPLTASSITSNSAIDVFNGHINLRDNSYFLQGRTVADGNVSLIGVDSQDRVFVGNAGYDTYIDSDTIVDGSLSATTLNINSIGGTTSVTNLGIDSSGNVVSGDTGGGLQPPAVATQDVIPFMNTAGTDAEYQNFFKFDGTSLWVGEDANNYCKINDATGSISMLDGGSYNLTMSPSAVSGGGKISSTTGAIWLQASTAGSYQLWLDRNNKRVGIYTSTPDATLTVQGGGSSDTTSALKIKNDSLTTLFEVKDGGTVVIPNVGSTTPVTNLGVDSSGNVVSGDTGGDVFKVGTPANNQLGVWTGDGTIEGDSNLTWNGVTLEVKGGNEYSRVHPDYFYQLSESDDANLYLYTKSTGTSVGSEVIFGRWDGTVGSESTLLSGQLISAQRIMGSHDSGNTTSISTGALIEVRAAENWSTTAKGVRYTIDTAAIGESTTTERFAIQSDGNVKVSGELIVGTVNSGTPVKNLAVDSSGKVVEASTSVSDQNKIFSWFMNVS